MVLLPGDSVWTYLDVTVTSLSASLEARAGVDGRALAREGWRLKVAGDSAASVTVSGARFVPIALSAYGSIEARSACEIRRLAHVADAVAEVDPAVVDGAPLPVALLRRVVAATVLGGAAAVGSTRALMGHGFPLVAPHPSRIVAEAAEYVRGAPRAAAGMTGGEVYGSALTRSAGGADVVHNGFNRTTAPQVGADSRPVGG